MAETPEQRLERLRREVQAEGGSRPGPGTDRDARATSHAGSVTTAPPTAHGAIAPAETEPAAAAQPPTGGRPTAEPGDRARPWSLREAIGEAGVGAWMGLALVAVGTYLVAARFVPGVSAIGSALLLVAGVTLLALHFQHRASSWALYAGTVLTGVGAARLVGWLLPIDLDGLTSLGVGAAFLAIGWLRGTQAGGYGWQGVLGVIVTGYGLLQLGLSLLPGSPGPLDLVLPAALIALGAIVAAHTLRDRPRSSGDRSRPAGP